MCNECAYCGTVTDPLRIIGDELTCQACLDDDDTFFALTTLDEWQEDQREEALMRGCAMFHAWQDDMMEAR